MQLHDTTHKLGKQVQTQSTSVEETLSGPMQRRYMRRRERYSPSVSMAQSVVIASAMEDPAVNVEGAHVVGVQTGVDTVTEQHPAAPWGVPFVVHLGSGHGQSARHDTPHGFRLHDRSNTRLCLCCTTFYISVYVKTAVLIATIITQHVCLLIPYGS